jgi:hypothetical protein
MGRVHLHANYFLFEKQKLLYKGIFFIEIFFNLNYSKK